MKKFLIIIFLGLTFAMKAQNNIMYNIGGGINSLGGGTFFSSFAYERNSHELTLRFDHSAQSGNYVPNFFGKTSLNDRFTEVAFLYGKAWRPKEWLMTSVSGGPGYFVYIDKYYKGQTTGSFISSPIVGQEEMSGIGLAAQAEIVLIIVPEFGFSFDFFCNLNARPVGGVVVNLVFGMLNDY